MIVSSCHPLVSGIVCTRSRYVKHQVLDVVDEASAKMCRVHRLVPGTRPFDVRDVCVVTTTL